MYSKIFCPPWTSADKQGPDSLPSWSGLLKVTRCRRCHTLWHWREGSVGVPYSRRGRGFLVMFGEEVGEGVSESTVEGFENWELVYYWFFLHCLFHNRSYLVMSQSLLPSFLPFLDRCHSAPNTLIEPYHKIRIISLHFSLKITYGVHPRRICYLKRHKSDRPPRTIINFNTTI